MSKNNDRTVFLREACDFVHLNDLYVPTYIQINGKLLTIKVSSRIKTLIIWLFLACSKIFTTPKNVSVQFMF